MIDKETVCDDLCISHLVTRIFFHPDGFCTRTTLGAISHYFALITHGQAELTAEDGGKTLSVGEGELFFIPRGYRYRAVWRGAGGCRLYSVGFTFGTFEENGHYSLQKVMVNPEHAREVMDVLVGHPSRAQMLSAFYRLWGETSPGLLRSEGGAANAAILPAIRRMEGGDYVTDVPTLAALCCMSETAFYRAFRAATGYTPVGYKNLLRCRRATELLTGTNRTLEEIAEDVGCSTPAYLRRLLLSATGKTPRELRKNQESL